MNWYIIGAIVIIGGCRVDTLYNEPPGNGVRVTTTFDRIGTSTQKQKVTYSEYASVYLGGTLVIVLNGTGITSEVEPGTQVRAIYFLYLDMNGVVTVEEVQKSIIVTEPIEWRL